MLLAMVALTLAPASPSAPSGLDQIHVRFNRQQWFEAGYQKWVVTITNTSKEIFKGTVRVIAVDKVGARVDGDSIPLNAGLPGGARKAAIVWLQNPASIATLKYQVLGSFEAAPTTKTDVPYEELGTRPGTNAMTVFVYTTAKDRTSLGKIVNVYRTRYASLNILQVFFFNDRRKAARALPMSDAALSVHTTLFWRNKSNGKEALELK